MLKSIRIAKIKLQQQQKIHSFKIEVKALHKLEEMRKQK
jgi:hypothetical protein